MAPHPLVDQPRSGEMTAAERDAWRVDVKRRIGIAIHRNTAVQQVDAVYNLLLEEIDALRQQYERLILEERLAERQRMIDALLDRVSTPGDQSLADMVGPTGPPPGPLCSHVHDGFYCSLPVGHGGEHAAFLDNDLRKLRLARWSGR